ncbi:MAG: PD-(D/E)XK nuclease family protein [Gemmataceae bacterium]
MADGSFRTAAENRLGIRKQWLPGFCRRTRPLLSQGKGWNPFGKPDVVAVNEAVGWIIDAKTGAPKASDRIQVMVYMWALPKTNPAFAGVSFTGKVIYKCGYNLVIPDEIDREFGQRVVELLKEVCGDVEPYKAPSFSECQYCPVTRSDCVDRVEKAETHRGETDEF